MPFFGGECAERRASEVEPDDTETGGLLTLSVMLPPSGSQNDAKRRDAVIMEWMVIIGDYTERQLSVANDKFPAISAIAERVAKLTGDEYIAGMWKTRFFEDLLWVGLWKFPSYRERPYLYLDGNSDVGVGRYVAPTWSWASVDGKVYHQSLGKRLRQMARVLSTSVTLENPNNPFGHIAPGASLQLAGLIRHNVHASPHQTDNFDAAWHGLWFEVPEGHALADRSKELAMSRHIARGIVGFDVHGEHTNRAFSAVLMAHEKRRDGLDSSVIAPGPEPRTLDAVALLITRVGTSEDRYIRIGRASIRDVNFFFLSAVKKKLWRSFEKIEICL
jgi:hypothetical protein